jgi:hypothetical protein
MWTFIAILAVVLTVMAIGVLVLPRPKRSENEPGADVRWGEEAGDADDFPDPGEPSPHRPDGRPIPGSRDDRHRHGAE